MQGAAECRVFTILSRLALDADPKIQTSPPRFPSLNEKNQS